MNTTPQIEVRTAQAAERAAVRTVTMILPDEVVFLIASYGAVHNRSVAELCREVVLEKFAPTLAEMGVG